MVETISSAMIALALIGGAFFTAQNLWKLDCIERRVKRLCELLKGEGDDGED